MVAAKAIQRSLFFALMQALPRRSSDTHGRTGQSRPGPPIKLTASRNPQGQDGRPGRAQNEDVQRRSLRCTTEPRPKTTSSANSSDVPESLPSPHHVVPEQKATASCKLSRTRRQLHVKDGTPVTKLALQRGASHRAEHNNSTTVNERCATSHTPAANASFRTRASSQAGGSCYLCNRAAEREVPARGASARTHEAVPCGRCARGWTEPSQAARTSDSTKRSTQECRVLVTRPKSAARRQQPECDLAISTATDCLET